MRPSNSMVVVTSCRCGILRTVTGLSASSVAAMIGSTAFFAPEIRISPLRRLPPLIINLSTGILLLNTSLTGPAFGRVGMQGQRM